MSRKLNEVYKCSVCGNIVEIVHASFGELVCCNKPMDLMRENTVDTAEEKHVPVIEKEGSNIIVTVGSAPHPMEKEHYIEWIELITEEGILRAHLKPGDKPQATFYYEGKIKGAREYCNLHGLWKS